MGRSCSVNQAFQESLLRALPYPGRTRTRREHQVAIDVLTKFH
jgi:hypothetical protein